MNMNHKYTNTQLTIMYRQSTIIYIIPTSSYIQFTSAIYTTYHLQLHIYNLHACNLQLLKREPATAYVYTTYNRICIHNPQPHMYTQPTTAYVYTTWIWLVRAHDSFLPEIAKHSKRKKLSLHHRHYIRLEKLPALYLNFC